MLVKENKGRIIEDGCYSYHLQQEIPLIIYVPNHYSSLFTYPVLYLQDGQDYFNLGRISTILDKMIHENLIEKCIIVAVPVKSIRERMVLYRPKGSKHEAYKRFFGEELVSHIDQNYSTHTVSGGRAIMGESLGATVALEIALQYPHTFHQVVSQSGAFYEGTLERVMSFSHPPSLLNIYQLIGTEETNVTTSVGSLDLLQLNRELKRGFEQKQIPHYYKESKGDHTWGYWQDDLPHALSYLWGISK
jgi:enterochelin esterase-like enzyme